jgi:N utilization substance protein B
MGSRRKARECALQLLYQLDIGGGMVKDAVEIYWASQEHDADVQSFANSLVEGVVRNLSGIDDVISSYSTNWKVSRMASIDKNILRIAVYELTRCPDIPVKVTINEAVEIAKCFGTEESGAFVNGILDNVAKKYAKEKSATEEGPE